MTDRQRNIELGEHISSLVNLATGSFSSGGSVEDFLEWLGRETGKFIALQDLSADTHRV